MFLARGLGCSEHELQYFKIFRKAHYVDALSMVLHDARLGCMGRVGRQMGGTFLIWPGSHCESGRAVLMKYGNLLSATYCQCR